MTYIAILTAIWTALFTGTVVVIGIEHNQPVLKELRRDLTLQGYFTLTWITGFFLMTTAGAQGLTNVWGEFLWPWVLPGLHIATTIETLRLLLRTHHLIATIEQAD
jgi:hypothetical protein